MSDMASLRRENTDGRDPRRLRRQSRKRCCERKRNSNRVVYLASRAANRSPPSAPRVNLHHIHVYKAGETLETVDPNLDTLAALPLLHSKLMKRVGHRWQCLLVEERAALGMTHRRQWRWPQLL
jgi:hypothetical protein